MSNFFSGLKDRARGLLGRTDVASVGNHTSVVSRTALDDIVYENVRSEALGFDRMNRNLHEEYDYTDDLLKDLFSVALSGKQPNARIAAEMRPSHRPHVAIEKELFSTSGGKDALAAVGGDEYDSALWVMSMKQPLVKALDATKEARAKAEEAQQQKEQAQQHAEAARQQESTAEQTEQKAEQAAQTAEQAQAAAEQAQQQAEAAQQAAQADPGNAEAQAAAAAAQGAAQAAADAAAQASASAAAAVQQAAAAGKSLEQIIELAEAALAGADAAGNRADALAQAVVAEMRQQLSAAAEAATQERDEERSLFEAFGYGRGELQRMSHAERAALAQRLQGSRLAKFHEMIGGFRMMEAAQRRRKTRHGHNEVAGVELGNDLSRLLPSEIVAMATPELEDDFWKRYTQHQLMLIRMRGSEKVGRGAIVVVCDESATMNKADMVGGATREAYSKALSLALLDRARSQGRDFVYVGFGSQEQQRVLRFAKGQGSLDDVMAMTEHFYNGGTHFETPLEMARTIVESEFTDHGLAKADVMFVTDGQAPISEPFVERWNTLREKAGFVCWGVAVSAESSTASMQRVCDNVRSVDEFTSKPTDSADIFRTV